MSGLSAINTVWVLIGAALVFFMQAGFAMVEAGFTRAKNSGNIIMKNLLDLAIGTVIYWFIGFGIMFGSGTVIGTIDFFITGNYDNILPDGVSIWTYVIFQTVFCATSATIVSGAMAERTKFSAYCIYSAVISLIIYPMSGHWIWGGGWLAQLGFHDFAGSTAVHMVGGVAALVGAKMLGARIGKYDKDGNSRAIPGHNIVIGALGVFILWFCWFGFNGCSTVNMEGDNIALAGRIFMNTNLSAAVASVTTMIFTWIRYRKPDVSMTLNGALAGLVGITAGCDMVSPAGAALIGLVCGIVIVLAVEFIDRKCKIDDPVGAISVHGVCGMLGTVMTGLLSESEGLFYGKGFGFSQFRFSVWRQLFCGLWLLHLYCLKLSTRQSDCAFQSVRRLKDLILMNMDFQMPTLTSFRMFRLIHSQVILHRSVVLRSLQMSLLMLRFRLQLLRITVRLIRREFLQE